MNDFDRRIELRELMDKYHLSVRLVAKLMGVPYWQVAHMRSDDIRKKIPEDFLVKLKNNLLDYWVHCRNDLDN